MSVRTFKFPGMRSADVGEKAQGLIDLHQLGLRVPAALIFPDGLFENYVASTALGRRLLIARATDAAVEFQNTLESALPLVSFRCGAKGIQGQPKLYPESVLDLGLDGNVNPASSRTEHLRLVCESHASAFFKFFHEEMVPEFASLPFGAQVEQLLTRLYHYFLQHPVPLGCSIILQEMVFGDFDNRSLTGMCYTRHPYTGVVMDYGHFIPGRQGLSLGGINSPSQQDLFAMRDYNPAAYQYLKMACRRLEEFYHDIRALEYTAEGETMYLLQNTTGNRTFRLTS